MTQAGFEPGTLQKEQRRLSLIVTPHATRQTRRIESAQLVGLKIFSIYKDQKEISVLTFFL